MWPNRDLLPLPSYILGLDLAKSSDWTALATVEVQVDGTFDVVHLSRWQAEPYTRVGARVAAVQERIREVHRERLFAHQGHLGPRDPQADLALVVDKTGVGAPVVDQLREEGLNPIAITIHGGDQVTQPVSYEYRVPKRDLVAAVAVLSEQRRLRVIPSLPLAETLRHELDNFKRDRTKRGHDTYNAGPDALSWREAPHDDLVLATAMAVWYGSRGMAAGTLGPADPDLVAAMADLLAVR